MSGPHTPGQLIVGTDIVCEEPGERSYPETPLYGMDGAAAVAVAIEFTNCPGMRTANARRLAACWNACDGLTQDHFDGGWSAKGLSEYAKQVENTLAAARALLAEVVKPHDDHVAAVTAAGERPTVNPLAARINNFLKGGAE
ncbi:hypothetical protein V3C40_01210 [Janthinobacterium sp. LS2A]|uniref:hypothetical protein n=1 Tax=Janthinobacterium sp. LS2A TaxID=3118590 RepID=UPI002F931BBD